MKTYSILFAEDVPHYGTAQIGAPSRAAAIEAAKGYNLSEVTTDPAWEYSACKRIVHIEDPQGKIIAEDIALDELFLRSGGDKNRILCDAATEMLEGLRLSEDVLPDPTRLDDCPPLVSVLNAVRAGIAKAEGGPP